MATVAELEEAVFAARAAGCSQLVLLRCTSAYPAPPEEANLLTIPHLRELFPVVCGISPTTPSGSARPLLPWLWVRWPLKNTP